MLGTLLSLLGFVQRLGRVLISSLDILRSKKDAALSKSFDEANRKATDEKDAKALEDLFRGDGSS